MKVRGQKVYSLTERIKRLTNIDPITGCWNWISRFVLANATATPSREGEKE